METVGSADGSLIAYEWSGRGSALVIVNGAFGDRRTGVPLANALHDDFTVYRYDRRGRGDSDDDDVYSVLREVEDLAAVADEAGGEPYVFGHSSGGALVLEAAAAGVSMRGLAVHEPPYVPGPGTSLQTADEFAALVAEGHQEEVAEQFLRNTGAPEAMVQQIKASDAWPGMVSLAHTLPYDIRLCNEGVVPQRRLAQISSPVLATAGELSPPWARAAAKAIAAAVPEGTWRLLEGQSHSVGPGELAALLRRTFAA
jgi:pimeloyl-ACP methyl ester carboxylesterase